MKSKAPAYEPINQDIRIGVTSVSGTHYACWKRDGTMRVYRVKGWALLHDGRGADRTAFDLLCIAWGIEPVTSGAKARKEYISEPIF